MSLGLHNQSSPQPRLGPARTFHAPSMDLPTTSWTVVMTEKSGRTELYPKCQGPYLTYQNVRWKLYLRKEVSEVLVLVAITEDQWRIHSASSARFVLQCWQAQRH